MVAFAVSEPDSVVFMELAPGPPINELVLPTLKLRFLAVRLEELLNRLPPP